MENWLTHRIIEIEIMSLIFIEFDQYTMKSDHYRVCFMDLLVWLMHL